MKVVNIVRAVNIVNVVKREDVNVMESQCRLQLLHSRYSRHSRHSTFTILHCDIFSPLALQTNLANEWQSRNLLPRPGRRLPRPGTQVRTMMPTSWPVVSRRSPTWRTVCRTGWIAHRADRLDAEGADRRRRPPGSFTTHQGNRCWKHCRTCGAARILSAIFFRDRGREPARETGIPGDRGFIRN